MTQRVLMCTMHFARKMRKWIGIPVKWNLELFLKAYLCSDWWWLEITFMYALECRGGLSAAPDTLHSRNIDAKSAPMGAGEFGCRSGMRSPAWEITRVPKYYYERTEREFETKAR